MNKVEEIFKAWGIMFNPNDTQAELAGKRMEICDNCESKRTIPIVNRVLPIVQCGECGCALKAKVYSTVVGACPKGKWLEVEMEWQSKK
jgi:hypothetical protein